MSDIASPPTTNRPMSALAAFRLSSITSVLVMFFGVLSNKLIALVAGPNGMALMGIYRALTTLLTTALPLGANDVITRQISLAKSELEERPIVSAAYLFLCGQAFVAAVLALFFARPIASLVFTSDEVARHLLEVRVVLALSVGVLAMQLGLAVVNGLGLLRQATRVGLVTSLSTLLTTYPFLLIQPLGLTFIIGATCFIGAGLAMSDVLRRFGYAQLHAARPRSVRAFLHSLPLSPSLATQPIAITSGALAIQALLSRGWGLQGVGYYNAGSMLEMTGVMVLMSSMRSYFLPGLGRLDDEEAKRALANRLFTIVLPFLFAGVAVLVLAGNIVLRVLFSADFLNAQPLVAVLGLSIVPQVVAWFYAMFLVHKAAYRTLLLLDVTWTVLRVIGTYLVHKAGMPLVAAAWIHVIAYCVSVVLYIVACHTRHRARVLTAAHLITVGVGFCALVGVRFLRPSAGLFAAVALAVGALGWRTVRAVRTT